MSAVSLPCAPQAVHLVFGWRSMLALAGYLVMQVGLWKAENKWDEEGSAAYLKAAGKKSDDTPETLEGMLMGDVTIPADELKAAFPVPCGGSSSAGGSGASATCSLWTARRTLPRPISASWRYEQAWEEKEGAFALVPRWVDHARRHVSP